MNLKKITAAALLLALFWAGFRWLLPLFSPFLLGALLALAAEPVVGILQGRLHLPRSVSVGIGVSMTFCLLAMATIALCAFLVRELGLLTQAVPDLDQAARSSITLVRNWLLSLTERTPQSLRPYLQDNVTAMFSDGAALLNRGLTYALGFAGNLLTHVPDSALGLGTSVLSGYMISAKLPNIRAQLRKSLSQAWIQPGLRAWGRMKHAVAGWLAAQFKLMSVTFFILTLGLTLLRIPSALLWALAISLVDALPVLGTGAVMIPWSAFCLIEGDTPRTIGLLGVYTCAAILRSVLEPKLLGHHLGLDPLVTLVVLYAGFKLWGIWGMLLAPLFSVAVTQFSMPAPLQEPE